MAKTLRKVNKVNTMMGVNATGSSVRVNVGGEEKGEIMDESVVSICGH
jgi:hypothetical protein